MATEEIKAIQYTCDGCGSINIVVDSMEILGYTGSVLWQYETGGHAAEWYACKPTCIKNAVTNALRNNF